MEFKRSFWVAASVRRGRRWSKEAECDLRRGVSVRYFLVSSETRLGTIRYEVVGREDWNIHLAGRGLLDRKVVVKNLRDMLQGKNNEIVINYSTNRVSEAHTKLADIKVVEVTKNQSGRLPAKGAALKAMSA